MAYESSLSSGADPNAIGQRLLQRAHVRDGLAEIYAGALFLLLAGLISAQLLLPRDSMGFRAAVLASSFLIPVLGVSAKWVLKRVRGRYLIERWGFVENKLIDRKQIGLGILFAALVGLLLFGVVPRLSQPDFWLLAGSGVFGGAILAWGGRLPRFVIEGAVMATTGVLVAFSSLELDTGFAILFGFQGLMILATGCVVFLRFIRQPIEPGEIR
ncbi:MAG: hypothetical protein WD733_25060 [Bryobacterales bacterium]